MTAPTLKEQLNNAVKEAMRNKDKTRLVTLRMAQSAVKQIEIDERRELNDEDVLKVLDKMLKQRRDAASQYDDAGREELGDKERAEMVIIEELKPQVLGRVDMGHLSKKVRSALS